MKPVVIIVIAVVCSVIGVFGLLVGIEMYEAYQYEKSVKFAISVGESFENYQNDIIRCIPNDQICFNQISNRYDRSVEILSEDQGINLKEPAIEEIVNAGRNFLQIEYDYLNEVYEIEQDFRYQQYQNEAYYGSGNVEQDRLVSAWQQSYRESLNNMRIEMAGREEKVDEDTLDYQFIKQFEELTKQKQEEDP